MLLSSSSSSAPSLPVIKMNYFAIFILLFVCLNCEAVDSNLACQVYDAKAKSLEKTCGSCTATQLTVDAATLEYLKFSNCDSAEVLNTTKLYPNIRELDISNSNYSTIDWFNTRLFNLKFLNASHNRIENITNFLRNAPHVTAVDLSHNLLRSITIESFGTLNELIDINLANNLIQHINSNAFSKISTNLEHIDLSNNNLVGIPELPTCQKLRILHLEENTIKNFTCQRIPWRDTFSALYLSWSYVERFDGSPEHCKRFRVVLDSDVEGILRTTNGSTVTYELQCNQHSFRKLRSFRAGRDVFHNVETLIETFDSVLSELDVSGNAINRWDQVNWKRFTDLRKLALSNTQLHTFNLDMLGGAPNLESIDISDNQLDQLDGLGTLKQFQHLKELNVSGNQFQRGTILKILYYPISDLEVLDLSDSHVETISDGTFDNFVKHGYTTLKTLNLRNTSLALADDRNPFEKLTQLHTLDLSHNNLSTLNFRTLSDTLVKLNNFEAAYCEFKNPLNILQYFGLALKRINLSGNRFAGGSSINGNTFQALTTLIHLNLSATDLREFDLKTVMQQKWLYTLDISHNQLQQIDLHELPHFEHMKRLYLNDNDLKKLDRFKANASPNLSLALARNQLPCLYLKQLKYDNPNLKYIGDQLDQKHGEDCRSSAQAIGDFLGSVFDTVKFW